MGKVVQQEVPVRYLRREEAARYLGLSRSTLENYAASGKGPRIHRPGGSSIVLYAIADLDAWLTGVQPCLFTREDVRQLRAIAEAYVSYDRMLLTDEGRAHIRSLADRIEALLPPEKPSP